MRGEQRNRWQPLRVSQCGVLRNKFGITDGTLLAQAEASFTFLRLAELATHPIAGQFDLAHLQAIHRYIFQKAMDVLSVSFSPILLARRVII